MWKPKPETETGIQVPGVEWKEYTDEEFDQLCERYDAQFTPEQARSLERFFDHVVATGGTAGAGGKN